MMAEKNLKLNEDKCVVIAMGTKKQREKVKVELETNPIMCGGFQMKTAEKEKWLRGAWLVRAWQTLSPKQ